MTTPAGQEPDLAAENRRLRDELETVRRQLRRAQPLATLGTMTAMIVHEFNNILTPMINYAELAADGDPEICAKAAAKTRTGGRRAIEICSAILAMVRSESSEPVTAPVVELVDDALTSMGRDFAKDGVELTVEIPEGLTVGARPAEMKQVLVNLLLNARAAILAKSRGGRVRIDARRDGQTVRLSVRDSGCGIPPEHMDKLFEPFFTTKTGDAEQGTGLGLALCEEVVTGLGGRIEVESAVGEGTCFTLILPARAGSGVTAA